MALAATAAVIMGRYVFGQRQETGYTGWTPTGMWNLYGRAAPFADCNEFTPPRGTRRLCEAKPPSQRGGPAQYVYDISQSPGLRHSSPSPERRPRVKVLVLLVAGPLAAADLRMRLGALLLSGMAVLLVLTPLATLYYNARFTIPSFGVIAAAAAIGGWLIRRRIAGRRPRARPVPAAQG